jgi:hypothetical protein
MPDFWRASGYGLLQPRPDGRLGLTDDFLRAYCSRPEVRPVEESGPRERALHEVLLQHPRKAVSKAELAAIEDADARDNYEVVLGFRDRLLAAATLEDAYLRLFLEPASVPPLFVDQLAHVILRHILDGVEDPLRARAGELFFRSQKVTVRDGAVMLADEETVEMHAATGGMGSLGRLIVESNTPLRQVDLDVLSDKTASEYWGRDDRYDTVLDLTFGRHGLDALARVLEAWVAHFLQIRVNIQPVSQIQDERWSWHVGLDAEASAMMNDLYNGKEVDEERLKRVISLFRLEFQDASLVRQALQGKPVYLGLAHDRNRRLRLKPQNLLVNLPLAERA